LGEVNGAGLLSAAAAPLISDNETLGAIFMGARRRRAFNERHTDLLRTMAHQTALAIRNAQLYARLGQMAILEERYRLSREIHDGLAQTLAYMGLQAERMEALIANGRGDEAAREAAEMRQLARAAYVDAREAIDGLRLSLDDPGLLAERLAVYFAEFTRQSGIPVQFDSQPPDLRVAPSAGLQLMRIAQEALTNVRKHAQASQVQVRLSAAGEELELTLADDGRGFPDALHGETRRRSYGLTTMRERAQSMGGALAVATGPGQGTRIVVTVPRKAAL
jgi:signal transduction histidine kinase